MKRIIYILLICLPLVSFIQIQPKIQYQSPDKMPCLLFGQLSFDNMANGISSTTPIPYMPNSLDEKKR